MTDDTAHSTQHNAGPDLCGTAGDVVTIWQSSRMQSRWWTISQTRELIARIQQTLQDGHAT